MWVAVVRTRGRIISSRPDGDWACFIAEDRDAAIKCALGVRQRWGGSYQILVGELTDEAVEAPNYSLRRIAP
jgi:hypothetical protein